MDFLQLFLFILPAYFANALPVVFGGRTPIDLGNRFTDGFRLLGHGKTFRGFLAGVTGGTLAGLALALASGTNIPGYTLEEKTAIAFLLSVGTMVGDVAGSFAKRRLGLKQGEKMQLFDRLPFLLFALAFALAGFPALAKQVGLDGLAFLIILTLVLHRIFNAIAHHLKLKLVPW
ncbi:CDP-2,3-bis-(O-geranylgeranyl)-sn-glycerol synthase [Candidatus Micrarchaeota archaeon]|nr:CDP-2,3-bis-(O-geranylgeranyl)-sn-glycerol synthase [Candidatus Micrarchaeota archaeon]